MLRLARVLLPLLLMPRLQLRRSTVATCQVVTAFAVLLALAAGPSAVHAAVLKSAPPGAPSKPGLLRRRLGKRDASTSTGTKRKGLKQTGVIVQFDVNYGIPGVAGYVGQGLVVSPVDEQTHKRTIAPYTVAGGDAFIVGIRHFFSPAKRYRSTETTVGPVNRGSKIFGDRIQVPIIPGVLMLGAGRTGGLGFTFLLVPLPTSFAAPFTFPWLRGSLSVYVTDPRLTGPANRLLDKTDLIIGKINHFMLPVTTRFQKLKLKLGWAGKDATGTPPEADASAAQPS